MEGQLGVLLAVQGGRGVRQGEGEGEREEEGD
jgi:hypothetical protein